MRVSNVWVGRARFVGLVLVLAVAGAVTFRYVFVPNWRPPLLSGERYGVDISHHQGPIDWPAVAGDGISFAYIKASEGGDFTDDRFAQNWEQARAAGLRTGAYHFFTLCTDGAKQARHFLSVAKPDPDALAPAVDLEFGGNCSERPSRKALHRELDEFLSVVEQAWGREALLYVFHSFEVAHRIRATYDDRPLWIPSYPRRPQGSWAIWQLHGFANVEGITGGVDLDVGRLDEVR